MSQADEHHAVLAAQLRRVLLMRDALEAAGLCGPDEGENDGREAAQAVIHALARQRVILHETPAAKPPPSLPPTLGERIAAGAIRLTRHLPALAELRPSRARRRRPHP